MKRERADGDAVVVPTLKCMKVSMRGQKDKLGLLAASEPGLKFSAARSKSRVVCAVSAFKFPFDCKDIAVNKF